MSYSISSNVGELLDNPRTAAILEEILPGFSNHPQIGLARGFDLRTASQYSGGEITPEHLEKADAALKALG